MWWHLEEGTRGRTRQAMRAQPKPSRGCWLLSGLSTPLGRLPKVFWGVHGGHRAGVAVAGWTRLWPPLATLPGAADRARPCAEASSTRPAQVWGLNAARALGPRPPPGVPSTLRTHVHITGAPVPQALAQTAYTLWLARPGAGLAPFLPRRN